MNYWAATGVAKHDRPGLWAGRKWLGAPNIWGWFPAEIPQGATIVGAVFPENGRGRWMSQEEYRENFSARA